MRVDQTGLTLDERVAMLELMVGVLAKSVYEELEFKDNYNPNVEATYAVVKTYANSMGIGDLLRIVSKLRNKR